ncbi:MAG TPA: hypothetical protein VM582_00815, partial [Candidatus Thermoplasmatota archaeon]|nr:hypothetical protein [Candidatus Thermoplasmatota archaeon]
MEPEALEAARRELVAWGVVEPAVPPVLSRRFRGAIVRAAARLAAEEQRGERRAGDPVRNAIDEALRDHPLPSGAVAGPAHRELLAA